MSTSQSMETTCCVMYQRACMRACVYVGNRPTLRWVEELGYLDKPKVHDSKGQKRKGSRRFGDSGRSHGLRDAEGCRKQEVVLYQSLAGSGSRLVGIWILILLTLVTWTVVS